MSEKKQEFHGSDLEKVEAYYGIKKEDIIHFAGNDQWNISLLEMVQLR